MKFLRRLLGKSDPPEREDDLFASQLVSALRARDDRICVEYDSGKFELLHVDENARGERMFLHNSFIEYRRLPNDEREAHLNRVVDFIIESRSERPQGDAALDTLLPVIRARADMLAVTAEMEPFPYSRASRPFCDNMLLMLASDSDVSIAILTDEILDELGVSFDDALGVAVAHLDERFDHKFGQLAKGTFVSNCGDFYDASRILLPDIFLQLSLNGNPVVIVQSRSSVLVTGSEDIEGLNMIAEFALQDLEQNERAVSLMPIEWLDGQWQPFDVQLHHPQSLRNLAPNQLCWSYNVTQEVLQQKLGDDIFVANAMLVEKDCVAVTLASWGAGISTACPPVDALAIEEDDNFPEIIRSLDDVLTVCGQFMEVDAMPYPQRFLLPARLTSIQRKELTEQYPEHPFFADSTG